MQGDSSWNDYVDYLLRAKLDWEEDVPCRDVGPQVMYPASESKQQRVAAKVCSDCTAQTDCLILALATDEAFGVWGGASEKQRAELKKQIVATEDAYTKASSITEVAMRFLKGQTGESEMVSRQMEASS